MTKHWPSDRVGKASIDSEIILLKCARCLAWFESKLWHQCDPLMRKLVELSKRREKGGANERD